MGPGEARRKSRVLFLDLQEKPEVSPNTPDPMRPIKTLSFVLLAVKPELWGRVLLDGVAGHQVLEERYQPQLHHGMVQGLRELNQSPIFFSR